MNEKLLEPRTDPSSCGDSIWADVLKAFGVTEPCCWGKITLKGPTWIFLDYVTVKRAKETPEQSFPEIAQQAVRKYNQEFFNQLIVALGFRQGEKMVSITITIPLMGIVSVTIEKLADNRMEYVDWNLLHGI